MNRLVAITGMALLSAGLLSWATQADAQPPSQLPSPSDLTSEASSAGSGGDPARSVELPVRPRQKKTAPLLPGTSPNLAPLGVGSTPIIPGLPALPPNGQSAKSPATAPLKPALKPPASDLKQGPYPAGPLISDPVNPAKPMTGSTLPIDEPGLGQRGDGNTLRPQPQPLSNGAASETSIPHLDGETDPNGLSPAGSDDHALESTLISEGISTRQEPSVSLEWVGSSAAKIGQPNDYTLVVRNTCNIPVQQVLVQVRIPTGLSCGDTEPKASAEGNVRVWELGALQSREEKVLHLQLVPEQKGDMIPQAWVTFTGSSVMRIKVREPKLALKVEGAQKVLMGEMAAFQAAVTNPGDGSADKVKIHVALTDGLECPRGSKIDFDIGNLAAGETRNVTVICIARAGGTQKCDVTAEAEGGLQAKETAPVGVTMPRLELQLVGPALRYLGRKAVYTLKVANPGDAPATNVTISDVVPDGFKVLAASDGGRHDFSAHTVSWFLGALKPGETHEVKMEVQAVNPGDFKHKASAVGAHNLCADSELTTRVEGLSALMLEMVDTDDPIEVSSETSYEVRISNTGSKLENDIKLVATIPDKMEFKKATGPVRYHEEGKTIVFEPLEKLAPKADAVFRIHVKALDQGVVRFKIQMTSTNLTEPVIKMEATRIYSDAPESKSSH